MYVELKAESKTSLRGVHTQTVEKLRRCIYHLPSATSVAIGAQVLGEPTVQKQVLPLVRITSHQETPKSYHPPFPVTSGVARTQKGKVIQQSTIGLVPVQIASRHKSNS